VRQALIDRVEVISLGGDVKANVFLNSAVLLLTVGASTAGAQGVLITQKISRDGAESTSQVQIDKTRMRTEVADPSGSKQAVVFDGDRQALLMINQERKSYSEITKADVDRAGGQMTDMMAKMPPEVRAKMEALMKGRGMGAGAPVKTVYKRAGTDKTAKWACDKYDGYQNTEKVSEICTVAPGVLGLSAADFAVTQQFVEFFKALMPQQAAGQMLGVGKPEEHGYSGIPIKSTFTISGRTTTTEVTDVSRQTFPDAVFAPPAGFKKEASPFGRGRGPQ
jgi:hypothetical protein